MALPLAVWFCVISLASGMIVRGMGNRRYWCPHKFLRTGNSCYYISSDMATWHEAYHQCRDMAREGLAILDKKWKNQNMKAMININEMNAGLAILDKKWKDQNMKSMLNRNEIARVERWIGGIYDWSQEVWLWGLTGRKLRYQGFSRRKPGDDYRWKCIVMDPKMLNRWGTRSCLEKKHYICETPLQVIEGKRKPRRRKGKGRKKNRRRPPVETNSTL